ncbi:MAG: LL-diaminopimelate aminotransferase [Eggerthellaceae bacterium]
MASMNHHYTELQDSYLFRTIDAKVADFRAAHPDADLLKLGIGDVTLPLPPAVIQALHQAVDDQAVKETFEGYQAEVGAPFFRQAVQDYYARNGVELEQAEIFVSSGAKDDLADLLDIFSRGMTALVLEPAYPAYVDANVISGNKLVHLPSSAEDDFAPYPDPNIDADIVYLCSPNNPTGATYTVEKLQAWVEWARQKQAVIVFDAAYESFIQDPSIPHSIYAIEGAKECAIEVCSLSKTAGFTGTRAGYTVVPKALVREGLELNALWVRNRTTKTNGISYVLQKAAAAALSPEGQAQCAANVAVYQENARVLMEALDGAGVWYSGGKNAPYVWMRCPGGLTSWEFFDKLLEEEQVVGTPGSGFGQCGEGYFRLTAFNTPENTREAAKRLAQLCARLA